MSRGRHIAFLSIAGVCIAGALGWFAAQTHSAGTAMHTVSLQIPGAIADVAGVKILPDRYGLDTGELLEPQHAILHTPDGTSFSIEARSSGIQCWNHRVSTVYLRRPIRPVRFLEAKADLLRTLSELHIQPDYGMKQVMSAWTTDAPGFGEVEGLIPNDWKAGILTPFHGLTLDVQISPDPKGGWYYLLLFSAVTPASVPSISPATQPSTEPAPGIRQASIKLNGTPRDVAGIDVHTSSTGMGEADLLDPQQLTIYFGDGQALSLLARSSNVMFFDGIVRGIFVRRPVHTISFRDAKADMLRTLDELHIQPDRSLRTMMSDWPQDVPGIGRAPRLQSEFQAALGKPVHGAELAVRLCPDSDSGWYYLLIFSDAMTLSPSTRPATAASSRS